MLTRGIQEGYSGGIISLNLVIALSEMHSFQYGQIYKIAISIQKKPKNIFLACKVRQKEKEQSHSSDLLNQNK